MPQTPWNLGPPADPGYDSPYAHNSRTINNVDDLVARVAVIEGRASDTQLRDRATHTGTQTASTVSDFTEVSQDIVGALFTAAGGTYNDGANTVAFPAITAGLTSLEALTGAGVVTATATDTFVMRAIGTGTGAAIPDTTAADARYAPFSHNQTASTISDFSEAVDDRVSALLVEGTNVTLTYNDAANTLTIASAGGGSASDLNGLTDVTISSPATGQGVRYNGTAWLNAAFAIGDITGLQAGLDAKASIASPTFTGQATLPTGSTSGGPLKFVSGALRTTAAIGEMEFLSGDLYFSTANSTRKTVAFTDSTITGNAANVTGTVAIANGGTGATGAAAGLSALGGAPIASPTFTGVVTLPTGSTSAGPLKFTSGSLRTIAAAGEMEFSGTTLHFSTAASTRKTVAFTDSNITGTAAGLSATLAIASGGTGATSAGAALTALGGMPLAGGAFTGRVRSTPTALTDGASIATDGSLSNAFTVTLGGNRTLANPTNLSAGTQYQWIVRQDGTGSRTLAYGSVFKWDVGAPTLSTAANSVNIITGYTDGTNVYAVARTGFTP